MKNKKKNARMRSLPLVLRAGPALRRAAKVARNEARLHGTAICYVKDGKIVLEKP